MHAGHAIRCLNALSEHFVEADTSRVVVGFYGLSILDVLGLLESKTKAADRAQWIEWIYEQQISVNGIAGFRPGPAMTVEGTNALYDPPHIIMSFSAILALAILRDDLSRVDISGLKAFLHVLQNQDGSFGATTNSSESDLRMSYAVFVICHLLDDWSMIDIPLALAYVSTCRTFEGGYGQRPHHEAQGGTTFCAIACLALASNTEILSQENRRATVRWIISQQIGGFCGRTGKIEDACYSFWCGGALKILGEQGLVDREANATFLDKCAFKFGGIAKAPGEHPDPMHTYMALAAMAIYPPAASAPGDDAAKTLPLTLGEMDVTINATIGTAAWARRCLRRNVLAPTIPVD